MRFCGKITGILVFHGLRCGRIAASRGASRVARSEVQDAARETFSFAEPPPRARASQRSELTSMTFDGLSTPCGLSTHSPHKRVRDEGAIRSPRRQIVVAFCPMRHLFQRRLNRNILATAAISTASEPSRSWRCWAITSGISWLSGGFVGVDVFVVISGYLIGAMILGEVKLGAFSLLRLLCSPVEKDRPGLCRDGPIGHRPGVFPVNSSGVCQASLVGGFCPHFRRQMFISSIIRDILTRPRVPRSCCTHGHWVSKSNFI